MKYISTRNGLETYSFEEVFFGGLSSDGGLFIPCNIPKINCIFDYPLSLPQIAFKIFRSYITKDEIDDHNLQMILDKSLNIDIPLHTLPDCIVAEMFHGPTFSFKDFALQTVGNFFEFFAARSKTKQSYNVVCATSGDTGSAAIYGIRGKENVNCFVLFPHNKISETQRKQMTTVMNSNIHCIAFDGTFDDCQNIVKKMFLDNSLRNMNLTAVNSLNWARILSQISYYAYISLKLEHEGVHGTKMHHFNVSVPTGNFGNALSAYYAKLMGFSIQKIIVATNENDNLCNFFATGEYKMTQTFETYSPSMDISIASNFERLIWIKNFQLFNNHIKACNKTKDMMLQFQHTKLMSFDKSLFENDFLSQKVSNFDTLVSIKSVYFESNYIIDPHTAVAIKTFQKSKNKLCSPTVCISTAHPSKFIKTIRECFEYTHIPRPLLELEGLPEKYTLLYGFSNVVKFIRNTITLNVSQNT